MKYLEMHHASERRIMPAVQGIADPDPLAVPFPHLYKNREEEFLCSPFKLTPELHSLMQKYEAPLYKAKLSQQPAQLLLIMC